LGFAVQSFLLLGGHLCSKFFFAIKLHNTRASEFQSAFYTCSLSTHHRQKSTLQQGSKKARQEEVGYVSSSVGELASQPTSQPASQPAEGLFCTSALLFFGW
jgi:hypothetical protein